MAIIHHTANASGQATCLYWYLKKRLFLKLVGCACLSSTPLLQACNGIASSEAESASQTHRPAARAHPGNRPRIDLEQPLHTETATFALG